MFFGGGFPFGGGMDGMSMGKPKNVDNTRFYQVLEVEKTASAADIKKAYRKLAIKHHPDKGGDPEKFKECTRAYEILSDPEKRSRYDQYGEDGVSGDDAGDPSDIFEMFFGGRRKPQGKRKGEDMVTALKVTLEQIYSGTVKKLAVNRDVICEDCAGHGGPADAMETCAHCKGQGVRVQIRQMGPMIQQSQSPCQMCKTTGKIMPEGKKCKSCQGGGVVKERKVLEVHVDPGVADRHKVTFSGEADQKPNEIPGDVIFVLEQQKHPIFERKQNNLIMEKSITLYEALTGFQFVVDHLDDRKLLVKSAPGETTESKSFKVVKGEGLPTHRNPFLKGDLYIVFNVLFPKSVSEMTGDLSSIKATLRKVLPLPGPLKYKEAELAKMEQHIAYVASAHDSTRMVGGGPEAYDEDDEEEGMGGHQRVQCKQQ